MINPRTDHYSFLGVPMNAPPSAIAAAIDRIQQQVVSGAFPPDQAAQIGEKLRRAEADLLSGPQRREGYDRWLMSTRGVSEPTVVAPLPPGVRQPPNQWQQPASGHTSYMPPPIPTANGAHRPPPSNNKWLIPLLAVLALLAGAAVTFAATHLLGKNSAALATATTAPTTTLQPATATPSPQPASTSTSAPARTPTTAPQITSTSAAPAGDPLTADPAVISSKGYTPAQGHAETSDGSGGTLYAWQATCTNSGDGYCQKVFFFDGTRYLGTDTLNDSASITNVSTTGPQTIAVTYAHYASNDPLCCPSLQPVTISYHWTGTRLLPSGTPPGH